MSTRDYGRVYPEFWTGRTGKIIRSLGRDAQTVSLYLITCPSANMIGIYYLPLPTLCHEIGISLQGATKALESLSEVGFCSYEGALELVWIPEMARFQIGEELKPEDNRVKGILKEIEKHKKSRFYNEFVEKYNIKYHLNLQSPLQAPYKPLLSQEQEQEHPSSCAELSEFARGEQNKNGRQPTKQKRKPYQIPEQALSLATKLKDSILANYQGAIGGTEAQVREWAAELDQLNRIDGKPWDQIERLLDWSQKDAFWKTVILSGGKFRGKWDQLLAKASAEQPQYSKPMTEEELMQEDDLGRLMRQEREKT